MENYIDFSNCKIDKLKGYRGANGKKISVIYNGERYMLKFSKENNGIKYNTCATEYLGCHIFNSLGIEAQQTILGHYNNQPVVACKDIETNGYHLMEFSMIKNTIIESSGSGTGTDLTDIMTTIKEQQLYSPTELKKHFWNVFVADSFIGNFDRHNSNWGLLVNQQTGDTKLAPIYDCGSSLFPRPNAQEMKEILSSPDKINERVFVFPTSAIQINNKKVNYFDYISSLKNPDCTAAVKRILPKINMEKINSIIENAPILPIQKQFYKEMLLQRKQRILDFTLEKYNELSLKRKSFNRGLER